ncbi:hypothetical protein [Bdellovibrio sp. HCB209]|uniref:hypothetical protein n=1 Tax=Bdellovibrio sp. HCB209 TaxID=3394354 RepID=UPI0039B63734
MLSKALVTSILCFSLSACLESGTKTVSVEGVSNDQYQAVVNTNATLVSDLIPRIEALEATGSGSYVSKSQLPVCLSSQKYSYDSLTDAFSCSGISVSQSAVVGLTTTLGSLSSQISSAQTYISSVADTANNSYQRLQNNSAFKLLDGGDSLGPNSLDLQNARSVDTQVASGNLSLAVGQYNTASQDFTTAIGMQNSVTGQNSVAVGTNNSITGVGNAVIGMGNAAVSSAGITLGLSVTNEVRDSITFGSDQKRTIIAHRKSSGSSADERIVFENSIPSNMMCEITAMWADGSVVKNRSVISSSALTSSNDFVTSSGKSINVSLTGNAINAQTIPSALGLWFDCKEF